MKLLLDKGADVNIARDDGCSIMDAIVGEQLEISKVAVDEGLM